jgi:hypothetical protein
MNFVSTPAKCKFFVVFSDKVIIFPIYLKYDKIFEIYNKGTLPLDSKIILFTVLLKFSKNSTFYLLDIFRSTKLLNFKITFFFMT